MFYDRGGVKNDELDPLISPLSLSDDQIDDLLSFLTSLTGSNVDALVSDAFDAPIGGGYPGRRDRVRADPRDRPREIRS